MPSGVYDLTMMPDHDPLDPPPAASSPQLAAVPSADTFTCTKQAWCGLPDGHEGWHRKAAKGAPTTGKTKADKPAKPSKPRPAKKASPAPGVLALLWAQAGSAVEMFAPEPAGPPAGRVMQFQAIDAGVRLDRLLQQVPAYKRAMNLTGGRLTEDIVALVAAPVLAGVMASDMRARMALWPVFSSMLASSAVTIAKAQREQIEAMQQVEGYEQEVADLLDNLRHTLFGPDPDDTEEPPA